MSLGKTKYNLWRAWTDGACYPNPGPAGAAAIIETADEFNEIQVVRLSQQSPKASDDLLKWRNSTNNKAELYAIMIAVNFFSKNDCPEIQREYILYSDSKWCVYVLRRDIWNDPQGWEANKNTVLRKNIVHFASPIKNRLKISWIPRNSHPHAAAADALAVKRRQEAEKLLEKREA